MRSRARHPSRARLALAFTVIALSAIACGTPRTEGGGETIPPPRGTLRSPEGLGPDFTLDHRITIRWQGRQEGFRGVLEKRGDTLTLVGLGPHGGRGFVLRQEGTEVSFESHLPEPLPFPPEHILMTLHRAWLLAIEPGVAQPDGTHEIDRDGEHVTEVWSAGLLRTRAFTAADAAGAFEVRFDPGFDPTLGTAPSVVTIEDGWLGYELTADAITLTPLSPSE